MRHRAEVPEASASLGGYVGPRNRVLKGRSDKFPTSRASVSSRKDE